MFFSQRDMYILRVLILDDEDRDPELFFVVRAETYAAAKIKVKRYLSDSEIPRYRIGIMRLEYEHGVSIEPINAYVIV